MLQDGHTYRTREAHERLKAICAKLGNPELAERAFGESHVASIMAKERNGWKPTPANLLPDIEKACMEHGHGGLWNSMGYDMREVTSIDMKACYPASFQGMGEAKPYFERFGHPTHRMTRVAINGPLPNPIGTGFAEVQEWEFEATCHSVIPAWFGRHFSEGGWAPTQLLAFLAESGLLRSLKVREAIISFEKQTEVWLPESRDQAWPSSANSPRAARQMEKGSQGGWWPTAASSITLSRTPASRALWSEHQWSASLVTYLLTMMVPSPNSPTWGQACWPMLTSTSSLCFQGLNPMRPSEWQPIPSM